MESSLMGSHQPVIMPVIKAIPEEYQHDMIGTPTYLMPEKEDSKQAKWIKAKLPRFSTFIFPQYSDEEYEECSNFDKARCSAISPKCMLILRYLFLIIPTAWLFKAYPFFFPFMALFESEWSFYSAAISILASILASKNPAWNKFAVLSTEMAFCMNCLSTPIFWIVLGP